MSDAAMQLLQAFSALPPEERHELLVTMLRQSGELIDSGCSDDLLVMAADELFQKLDEEESDDLRTETR